MKKIFIIELILILPLLAQVTSIPPEDSLENPLIWVAKTDSVGRLQWTKAYDGELAMTYGMEYDVAQLTSDGGIIITGGYFHTDWIRSLILIKLNSEGDSVWTRTFDREDGGIEQYFEKYRKKDSIQQKRSYSLFGRSVIETSDKGYLALGELYVDSICRRNPGPPYYYEGFLLIKTDSLGQEQWRKRFDADQNKESEMITHSLHPLTDSSIMARIFTVNKKAVPEIVMDYNGNILKEQVGKYCYKDIMRLHSESQNDSLNKDYLEFDFGKRKSGDWSHLMTLVFSKYDENNKLLWERDCGYYLNLLAFVYQKTADGGYIFADLKEYDPERDLSRSNTNQFDPYLAKFDAEGNLQWRMYYPSLVVDLWGAIWVDQTDDKGYIMISYYSPPFKH